MTTETPLTPAVPCQGVPLSGWYRVVGYPGNGVVVHGADPGGTPWYWSGYTDDTENTENLEKSRNLSENHEISSEFDQKNWTRGPSDTRTRGPSDTRTRVDGHTDSQTRG